MRHPTLAHAFAAAVLSCACACSDEGPEVPEVPSIAYCEDVSDWDPAHAAFEREVLALINGRRAEGGDCESGGEFLTPAEPLAMAPALRCAARKHVSSMIADDYFAHENPAGETFVERSAAAEYDGAALGESIAAGQRDPERVVATWMNNDGNCANLLDPEATELGVGYLPASGVTHAHYWTVVFGRRE